MKKFILPAAVIMIGAGSAFASNATQKKADAALLGFRYDPSAPVVKCIETPVDCTTQFGELCTWDDGATVHQLYQEVNSTMCGVPLYKIN